MHIISYLYLLKHLDTALIVECHLGIITIDISAYEEYDITGDDNDTTISTKDELNNFCGEVWKVSTLDYKNNEETIIYQNWW
jgi:hypothetical protein